MKVIDAPHLAGMKQVAAQSPRRRSHATLHDELSDPVQRVVIALEPGTYVRPHRHADGVWELFVLLEGACTVLVFDDAGTVLERVDLGGDGARIAQVPPHTWHTVLALQPGTVAFEVKPGPYCPLADKDFAFWAPEEGAVGVADMVCWFERAQPGEAHAR